MRTEKEWYEFESVAEKTAAVTNDTIIDINSNLVTLKTNVILQIVDIGNRTALFHFQTRLSEGIVLQQTRQHWLACDVWQISSKSERILSIKRTIHWT